jgi:Tfp pilus assembly protein PilX
MKARERFKDVRGLIANERGIVLVISLLVMTLLSVLGITFMALSGTERTIASNEVNTAQAFGVAEAGIEHARRELVGVNLDALLAGGNAGVATLNFTGYGTSVSFAGGSYSVTARNNTTAIGTFAADVGGTTDDTDTRVILTSTGTYRNGSRVIESLVQIPTIPTPPGGVGAFGQEATVEVGGGTEVNGKNYNPDTGALDPSVPSIPGVTFNSSDSELKLKKDGVVDGSTGATPYLDATLTSTEWRNLANTLIPYADYSYTSPATVSGTQTWGTATSPSIISIAGPANQEAIVSGNVTGVGILIVSSRFKVTGTFNFQGVVIVLEDVTKKGKVDVVHLQGDATIYGTVILASQVTGDIEHKFKLKGRGDSKIRYSKLAIDRAKAAVFTTISTWREAPS